MKQSIIRTIILCTFWAVTQTLSAQNIQLGGGIGYGSKSKQLSLNANIFYKVPDAPFRIGSNLGYTTRGNDDNRRTDRYHGNLNGYLTAISESDFLLYTITGLSLTYIKTKYTPDSDPSYSVSDFYPSANAGIGMETDIGIGWQFTEAKYIIGHKDVAGFVVNTGIRINL